MPEHNPLPPPDAGPDSAPSPARRQAAPPASPGRRTGPGCAGALVLITAIAAVLIWAVFARLIELPGAAVDKTARLAGQTKDALAGILQITPRIIARNTIVFEQNQPILEIALLSRDTLVRDEFEHSYLGSTKRIRLEGLYTVKAGYDLGEPFSAVVADNSVTLHTPAPRILSVEQKRLDVLEFRNGIWNKIRPDELEDRLNLLNALARERINREQLAAEVEKTLLDRLREHLGPGVLIRINPPAETPAASPSPKG